MTSTSSTLLIPVLSDASKVSGSSPPTMPGVASPVGKIRSSFGSVGSLTVTIAPNTCALIDPVVGVPFVLSAHGVTWQPMV